MYSHSVRITPSEIHLISNNNNKKNMGTKFSWSALFSSKTVWLNVIVTIIGYATYLTSVASFDKYAVLLGGILALGNLILKIWFNTTAIASTPIS